ncbi:MAG: hypothetical protein ACLU7D_05330 [Collinsella sp.]
MLVYVRGAGDIATGVAARLVRAGVSVVMADIAVPTCIRRTISFCEAIRLGEVEVEGIRARLAQTPAEALAITEAGDVAVVVDPQAKMLGELKPAAVVDAILAKRNLGTTRDMAPAVIAVGPGFTAPVDCDAVVETMRGHFLGRDYPRFTPAQHGRAGHYRRLWQGARYPQPRRRLVSVRPRNRRHRERRRRDWLRGRYAHVHADRWLSARAFGERRAGD